MFPGLLQRAMGTEFMVVFKRTGFRHQHLFPETLEASTSPTVPGDRGLLGFSSFEERKVGIRTPSSLPP